MDRATYPEVVAVLLNPKSQIRKSALGGQPYLTPPYLVLHCEEFAWPRVSPRAPVRSYFKPLAEPHRFTHHPDSKVPRLVCSLLHLLSPESDCSRSNAPPLAG